MIKFETMYEMLAYLVKYKDMKNRYYDLCSRIDGVKSPRLTDEPISTVPMSKEHLYNHNIAERDELMKDMIEIEELITSIKDIDYLSYFILWDKYIEGMKLEVISYSIHYSYDHIKHRLYPKAKDILFNYVNSLDDDDTE